MIILVFIFFFQAEDGIRDVAVTGTCALPISSNVQLLFIELSAHIPGGVFRPMARPFALLTLMFADKALPGRLLFAMASFVVFPSAFNALMKLSHVTG